MKLYLIKEYDYDHCEIIGNTHDLDLANRFINFVAARDAEYNYDYEIEELEVDSITEESLAKEKAATKFAVKFIFGNNGDEYDEPMLVGINPNKETIRDNNGALIIYIPVELDDEGFYNGVEVVKAAQLARSEYLKKKYKI